MSKYGDINRTRVDVRGRVVQTLDLRAVTGGDPAVPDASRAWRADAHPFTLSVFDSVEGDAPTAEILCFVDGVEVALVGALTGRLGVREVTPDLVEAARRDPEGYRRQLAAWLGIA